MKYTVVFCIMVMTTAPAIYKKDVPANAYKGNTITVTAEKCDSIKFNSITDVNIFLTKITPEVKIKAIRTSTK